MKDAPGLQDTEEMGDSQRRIVEAAVATFVEHGYHGSATSEIARRAGVAEGTIFRYYRTKQALLLGVVAPLLIRAITPLMRQRLERVMSVEYVSARAFVRALAAERLEFVRAHPDVLRLVVQEIPFHPELRLRFHAVFVSTFQPLLFAALDRMRARKLIGSIETPRAARLIVSSIIGFVLVRVLLEPGAVWDDEAELDAIADVVGGGLAP